MTRWTRVISVMGGARVISVLGGLYVALAVGRAIRIAAAGGPLAEAVSGLILVGIPGIVILYGGYRLPESGLHPDTYPRVLAWCLGGFGLLLGVVGLRILSPGVTIDDPLWSVALATVLGTVAGLAIGTNEARAFTRAREAEQRNQELERTKEELEDTVAKLQASNERLEQFAYAASHDLQEPLRMVSSYLQLLENRYTDTLDADAQEFIDFAVGGADRMRAMIESLLEYSRVTTRGEPFEPTDAEAVLEDVLDDLHMRIEETDATITADTLPTVAADANQLAQVFRNLLLNALEYSGNEPPRIHIGVERTDVEWQFSVADEGIGIDPDHQDRIFKIFERLHRDEEHSGGGIGLALCQRIVERHGGKMWVESDPDEGATFYFTISLDQDSQPGFDAQPDKRISESQTHG